MRRVGLPGLPASFSCKAIEQSAGVDRDPDNLLLTSTGLYTVSIWMREDGLRIDRLLLTTDTNFIPTSFGPAETERYVAGTAPPTVPLTRTMVYTYDNLYRLTEADYTSGENYQYEYDPVGNRLKQIIDGDTTDYLYDAANRLEFLNGQPVYTFDANGNLLESDVLTNTFDAANRLTNSTNATNATNSLTPIYNGVNDRVAQVTDGVTTTFALDVQGLPEVIYTSDDEAYLHLPGVIMTEKAGEVRYLLSDGLGSVRQVVDENAEVVAYSEFDPYGNPVQSGDEPYGFTGDWWQDDVELLHLRARWYLPTDGVFLSRDPIQSEPPYLYVRANPINVVDPSGLCPPGVPVCRGENGVPIDEYYQHIPLPGPISQSGRSGAQARSKALVSARRIMQNSSSNVLGLIRWFEADGLPGCTAQERLDWILNITSLYIYGSYIQFGSVVPQGDSGFRGELADSEFFVEGIWGESPNKQLGHFLTAVALGNDPGGAYYQALVFGTENRWTTLPTDAEEHAFNLIVGHEMVGDIDEGEFYDSVRHFSTQYHASTKEAVTHFKNAVDADRDGNDNLRDQKLRAILIATDPLYEKEDFLANRRGNSMQDLRNSVKGWRFGEEIREEIIYTRREAARWLRREVYDPSRTR